MSHKLSIKLTTAAASLLLVTSSHADVLVSFFDGNYSADSLVGSAKNIHADVTATDMSRVIFGGDPGGSGGSMRDSFGIASFTDSDPSTGKFFFTYNGANAPATVGDTAYMQFKVTADPGLTLDLSDITLDWAWASDLAGTGWDSSLDVQVSTDGANFSTVTGSTRSQSTGTVAKGNFGYFTGGDNLVIDMSSLANAAEYTIRIRSADTTTSNSHATNLFQNIVLDGAAVAIPEPSAALITSLSIAGNSATVVMKGAPGTDYYCAGSGDLTDWTTEVVPTDTPGSPFQTNASGDLTFTVDISSFGSSYFFRVQDTDPSP